MRRGRPALAIVVFVSAVFVGGLAASSSASTPKPPKFTNQDAPGAVRAVGGGLVGKQFPGVGGGKRFDPVSLVGALVDP